MMITPLKAEGRQWETKPLPLGLHVLHAYTRLKNGSGRVSLVVRNVSDSQIFLKKGVLVAWVVSAMLVSPVELSTEMEATLGEESRPELLSVAARQEKLLEKLNLDGLAHWSPENAVAMQVPAYTPAPPGGGMCLSQGYAGGRGDSSEPIPMVQHSHSGLEEGQHPAFLCGLQAPQCMYEERFVPPAMDSGGPGEHGRVGVFFIDGFQVRLLADQDGPGITTVHSLHCGEPRVLRVYTHALQAVQHTGDVSASHAEHLRGVEPHVLCHLLGRRDSLWQHRRGTPGMLARGI